MHLSLPCHAGRCAAAGSVIAILTCGSPGTAGAQEGRLSFRTGIERVSGDYGGVENFGDLYAPFTVLYERQRLAFRATLPYLKVEFADSATSSTFTESGCFSIIVNRRSRASSLSVSSRHRCRADLRVDGAFRLISYAG